MKNRNPWNSLTKPTISSSLKKKGKDENSPVRKQTTFLNNSITRKSPLALKKLDFNAVWKPSLAQKIIQKKWQELNIQQITPIMQTP